jgi:PAS domain S-box-containing protein
MATLRRTNPLLWSVAAVVTLVALVVADELTSDDVVLIPMYVAPPLVAALGCRPAQTLAVGVLSVIAAVVMAIRIDDFDTDQGLVRLLTVSLAANLAVWTSFLRDRLERSLTREGFLARAGELLTGGTGQREALQGVAEMAVPGVADRAAIDLAAPDGGVDRVAAAGAGTAPDALDVVRTGEPQVSAHALTVALTARGRAIGALSWAVDAPRTLGQEDVALAQILAARCALHTDNARLLEELGDAFGLLDVIFERAPVGLAVFDRELRYQRVNDHLAEINGRPVDDHPGRALAEVVPNMDPGVEEAFRRVLDEGAAVRDIEVVGETQAQPGVMRTWLMSCWPVRRRGEEAVGGVGAVILEVTAERAAARRLRQQTDRYETLLLALSEVGEGMFVLEDSRLVYANPAFEHMTGYALEELRAMEDVFELATPSEREGARTRAEQRVDGFVDPHYTVTINRRDGQRIGMEIAGVPLEVDGHHQLVVVGRDITARRRAEAEREAALQRTAFLAEAGERFDEVLDLEPTLQIAAELAVRIADACMVALHGTELVARAGAAPEQAPHAMSLSLRARGRRLGVMELGFAEAPGPERERELRAIFVDLARRAALALDNARLYQERSDVARTLQRSLLPPELPDVPGIEVAARYVAAGSGNEVGGDFYDCFSTGGGEWALVIGDVCGKGAEAAAITALARYTIRAAVLHTRDPAEVLAELNEAIRRQQADYRFCTALYAAIGPSGTGMRVTLSSGGHPLPLVLRSNGTVESVGAPGTLLGIVKQPALATQGVQLEPGDAMVLYTDGVIEASPVDDRFGPGPFAAFLATLKGRPAAEIAQEIEREVLAVQGGAPRDDVALLVVRLPQD